MRIATRPLPALSVTARPAVKPPAHGRLRILGAKLPADRCRTDPGAPRPAYEYSSAARLAEAARGGPGQTQVLRSMANRPDKLLAAVHPQAAPEIAPEHLGCAIRAMRNVVQRPDASWRARTAVVVATAEMLPRLSAAVLTDAVHLVLDGLEPRYRVRLTERGQHHALAAALHAQEERLPTQPPFVRESIRARLAALPPAPAPDRN